MTNCKQRLLFAEMSASLDPFTDSRIDVKVGFLLCYFWRKKEKTCLEVTGIFLGSSPLAHQTVDA